MTHDHIANLAPTSLIDLSQASIDIVKRVALVLALLAVVVFAATCFGVRPPCA